MIPVYFCKYIIHHPKAGIPDYNRSSHYIMQIIDIVFIAILAIGGLRGFRTGFLMEAFSIGAILLGIMGSMRFVDPVLELLRVWIDTTNDTFRYAIIAVLFVSIFFFINFLGKGLRRIVKPTSLGVADNLFGACVSIGKWGLVISALIWGGELFQVMIPKKYTESSLLFPLIKPLLPRFIELVTQYFPSVHTWGEDFSDSATSINPRDA